MEHIVITGSSRGIGFHMAKFFLEQGHQVVLSGSSDKSTHKAYEMLVEQFPRTVFEKTCDVRQYEDVENLSKFCTKTMGQVDIWINNAGISQTTTPTYLLEEEEAKHVIDVNIQGVINGSKVAINMFKNQGFGSLYNMEGLGSDGRISAGLAVYGGTKRFLRYYTRALSKEAKNEGYNVLRISPGMVTTDLLLKDIELLENPESFKKIVSILADDVEVVAPWLGKSILNCKKNGKLIAWLTTPKVIFRFLTRGIKYKFS